MSTATTDSVLRGTSTEALLRTAYALTHKVHAAERATHYVSAKAREHAVADLREQRDRITAEVLRRTTLHDMALPHPDLPGLTHAKRDRLEQEQTR